MNWKKFSFAFIAAFVFLFAFGFLWYATLMHDVHREVPTLLRPEDDLRATSCGSPSVSSSWHSFSRCCARYVRNGRAGSGAMLGLLVGLVYAGPHLISFAVQPLTFKILFGWIAGAVIQFTIAGAIVGAIYKPASEHSCT